MKRPTMRMVAVTALVLACGQTPEAGTDPEPVAPAEGAAPESASNDASETAEPSGDEGFGAPTGAPPALDLARLEIVDLTHSLGEDTLFWPTSPSGFELETLARGQTEGGYFYAANRFCTPEHGGTHLDAPIHFGEGQPAVDALEVDRLIGPAVVLDVTEEASENPDYRLDRAWVERWEINHGPIPEDSLVLLRTGWSDRWPDRERYFGNTGPEDIENLHFPSYGEEAARYLVQERRVAVLGVDTASIDYGQSKDFIVHQVAALSAVPGLENLTRLDRLPPTGAWVFALPAKIAGGTGAPVRVVALIPEEGEAASGEEP
ncbi:MAG: cyclase family protein [Thermoanaerobaculia bacterium]|nr:cyclase family protein [Thermoanaerobaculia bacterium]